jgi:carboxyl-terminal processing protease
MRGPGRLLNSAFHPRNLLGAGLLAAAIAAIASGVLPIGPRPSEAVEPRLVTEAQGPSADDRNVARVVAIKMKREHLTKHPLDNEISRRGIDLFLKSLDGMKLYFYQSDVDEFMQRRDDLDDMVSAGDLTLAYTVFHRLLKRIDERVALANELLSEEFDFTADETLVTDPDKLTFPKTPAEAQERWRKRLKYDILVLKSDKTNKEDIKQRLRRRYASFAKRMHQTDSNELREMFLTSVTSAFDPHSTYMAPVSSQNFGILMGLQLEGIGAQLRSNDGYTVIDKLIPGGPADKNGQLKAGDRIVSVGQGEDEPVDVAEMKLNDVVKLIRGRAGSIVRLGVLSEGANEVKFIKITRAKIELKDQEANGVIYEEGRKADGTPFKIGFINLPSFYMDMKAAREGNGEFKSCSRDVRRILDDFNRKGVDAVVLDLRKNGGGSLTEAIALTGLFIEQGPVLQVKDPDGLVQQYDDTDRGIAWRGPLVVMISKFSASASEILAGAIQDYQRGLVVGDSSTHGKGTVQTMMEIGELMFRSIANPPDLGSLKLTVQQFYRPSGDSTQQRGVLADIVLPSLTDHMDVSERDLDYPIPFDKVPATSFRRYDGVNANTVTEIKELSAARVANSPDFAKLLKNIKRYEEQKAKKEVPLNEQKFLARRAEFDAEGEDEKTFEEQANAGSDVLKRTYYENEVLAITTDYLRLLGKDKVAKAAAAAAPN